MFLNAKHVINKSRANSLLFKYNVSKLGWGVKALADNADVGGGFQNQGKLADVILEHTLPQQQET